MYYLTIRAKRFRSKIQRNILSNTYLWRAAINKKIIIRIDFLNASHLNEVDKVVVDFINDNINFFKIGKQLHMENSLLDISN